MLGELDRPAGLASQGFMNQMHCVYGLLESGDLHGDRIPPNVFASLDPVAGSD
jgi:hypothetical protein